MSRNAFLSLFAVPPLLVAQTAHNAPPKPLAITHVTVIDATGAAAELLARFAKNGTWQVPTLTVNRAMASLTDEEFTNDPRLKYMPPVVREGWNPKNDFRFKNYIKEDFAHRRIVFKKHLEVVLAMHRAGVGLPGTSGFLRLIARTERKGRGRSND